MEFTSLWFVALFFAVYAALWCVKWLFGKKASFLPITKFVLLASSYAFLTIADWRFSLCVLLYTVLIYVSASRMKKSRLWLLVGILLSVGQLVVFKYLNFFIGSFSRLLGTSPVILTLLVPLGVSFYSFSGISYIVDVYRKKYEANPRFVDTALYISFFPKLTSGPIVRADRFFDQLNAEHTVSLDRFQAGIQPVVVGLFKKMVLADHLNLFVTDVFSAPTAFAGSTVFLATIAYSLQIYLDFSGYSEIAIGLSKMMGFDFDRNFNLPYLSQNPTEFWKRWHISLSSWLQEYLYYPLGGNRKDVARTYINLFLTMLIGGLWHGADWTFIIWGGLNGLALVVHKVFLLIKVKVWGKKDAGGPVWKTISCILTFLFIDFTWIFFRADSVKNAFAVIRQIFSSNAGIRQPFSWTFLAIGFVLLEIAIAFIRKKSNDGKLQQDYLCLNLQNVWQLALFFTLIGITIMMAFVGDTVFIYGKF